MRYAVQSYKLIGRKHFRVIDTFNGGEVLANGFQSEERAVTHCNELNENAALRLTRMDVSRQIAERTAKEMAKGNDALAALRIVCGNAAVNAMIDEVYEAVRAKAVRSLMFNGTRQERLIILNALGHEADAQNDFVASLPAGVAHDEARARAVEIMRLFDVIGSEAGAL